MSSSNTNNEDKLDAMFKRNWDEYMKLLDELSDENGVLHAIPEEKNKEIMNVDNLKGCCCG